MRLQYALLLAASLTLVSSAPHKNRKASTAVAANVAAAAACSTASVAAVAAVAATGEEEEKKDETNVAGIFNNAIAVPGGKSKTDILFTANAAGSLEVEYNGTDTNTITVTQNKHPAAPPAGFLFVDPTTFKVATSKATSETTDIVKIDYIFTPAVAVAIDPTKGVIGKLDAATNTFIMTGLGEFEFEFEADENEWTLTVPDLNGEWAVLVPQSAVKTGAA